MAFARHSNNWRLFQLSGFSLPAVAASIALLLMPYQHKLPSANAPPEPLAVASVSPAKPMPYEGFGLPVPPLEPDSVPSQPHTIIVQAGSTLWKMAREFYGKGKHYPVILNANRKIIAKPGLIYPGQQFVLPDKKAD